MLWPTLSFRRRNRSTSNCRAPHRAVPPFWRLRPRHGWCEPTHTHNPPWRSWCECARSSWPTRAASSSSALLMRQRFTPQATRSCSREFIDRVLLPATSEYGASWDRLHRHRLDSHELGIRHFADWILNRPLSGGVSWRRFAGPGGNGYQVSGRCHDRVQLGNRVSRRQRLFQHGCEFHRQQFRRGRHVSELDGTTPTTVCQQSFVDPYGHHHRRCSCHDYGGPARGCLSSLCSGDDRVLLFLYLVWRGALRGRPSCACAHSYLGGRPVGEVVCRQCDDLERLGHSLRIV